MPKTDRTRPPANRSDNRWRDRSASAGRDNRRPPSPDRSGQRNRRGGADSRADSRDRTDAARPTTDIIYGRNAVRETLRANRRTIRRMLVAEGVRDGGPIAELEALAIEHNILIMRPDRRRLDDLTDGANHQGVALETGLFRYSTVDQMLELAQSRGELPLLLLLDHLQDPQNIGTLLRTAEAIGVHGVVLPDRRAAAITPSVVNASAGAVEHLLVAEVTNLVRTIEELKQRDVWVAGLEDDPRAVPYDRQRSDLPLALVVGAEGPGLSRLVRDRCDFLLQLPMTGNVASLNAATAGSIALYTLWRRRSDGANPTHAQQNTNPANAETT